MKNKKSKYTDTIERYLEGTLTNEQKLAFESELKSNKELLNEFKFRKKLARHWSKAKTLHDTRSAVKNIIKQQKKQKKKRRIIITLAAILAGLVFVPAGIWFSQQNNNLFLAKQKSPEHETYKPGMHQPEQRANRYEYMAPELLYPTNGAIIETPDTIIFKWKPILAENSFIEIFKHGAEMPLIQEKVLVGDTTVIISLRDNEPGKYLWNIKAFDLPDGYFEIKKQH